MVTHITLGAFHVGLSVLRAILSCRIMIICVTVTIKQLYNHGCTIEDLIARYLVTQVVLRKRTRSVGNTVFGAFAGRSSLPRPESTQALQEIADHLNALTTSSTDSLPLALAHTALNGDDWQGLGLLSGSRLSDVITTLAVFGTTSRYEDSEGRWITAATSCRPR
jgi:hypothetical protein